MQTDESNRTTVRRSDLAARCWFVGWTGVMYVAVLLCSVRWRWFRRF